MTTLVKAKVKGSATTKRVHQKTSLKIGPARFKGNGNITFRKMRKVPRGVRTYAGMKLYGKSLGAGAHLSLIHI